MSPTAGGPWVAGPGHATRRGIDPQKPLKMCFSHGASRVVVVQDSCSFVIPYRASRVDPELWRRQVLSVHWSKLPHCAKSLEGKHLVVVWYKQPGPDVPCLFSPLWLCPPCGFVPLQICPHDFVPHQLCPPMYGIYIRQSTRSLAGQLATRDKTLLQRTLHCSLP